MTEEEQGVSTALDSFDFHRRHERLSESRDSVDPISESKPDHTPSPGGVYSLYMKRNTSNIHSAQPVPLSPFTHDLPAANGEPYFDSFEQGVPPQPLFHAQDPNAQWEETSAKKERSVSYFDGGGNSRSSSPRDAKEKLSELGGILLAMSGQYYASNGTRTPHHQRKNNHNNQPRRYHLHSLPTAKGKQKKSKNRRLPVYPNESMFVEREEVQLGRMQYTIKAYFPRTDQVRRFKHNIRKLRSTSVVNQRLLPGHCQSQSNIENQPPPLPLPVPAPTYVPEAEIKLENLQRGPLPPPRPKKSQNLPPSFATTNLYIPIREQFGVKPEETAQSLERPLLRQHSQDPVRKVQKKKSNLREGESMLVQAGRMQLASSKINRIQPLKSASKKKIAESEPKSLELNEVVAGSALNACRAQSSRRIPKAEEVIEPVEECRSRQSERAEREEETPKKVDIEQNDEGGSNALTRSGTSTPTSGGAQVEAPVSGGGKGAVKLEPIKEKPPQPRIDFEKRHLEHLKAIMDKKKQENQLIERERKKMQDTRDKLKKMILTRVERRKNERQEGGAGGWQQKSPAPEAARSVDTRPSERKITESKPTETRSVEPRVVEPRSAEPKQTEQQQKLSETQTPQKKISQKVVASPPAEQQLVELGIKYVNNEKSAEEREQEERSKKLELQKLQKFYRSRYATMLQNIKDNLKSKKEKEAREQEAEQRKREMLRQQIGVSQVQSRFRRSDTRETEPSARSMPPTVRPAKTFYKPSAAAAPMKTESPERVRAKDDGDLSEIKEEQREDKLLKKHQQFLEDLQKKKQKEKESKLEEQKRKERIRSNLREMVKQQNASELEKRQKTKAELEKEREEEQRRREQEERKKAQRDPAKMAEVSQNFLERNMVMKRGANKILITDMAQWKKRNKVEDKQRVFFCNGGYTELKRALKERNWVENKDMESPCFDLKWTLKAKDIIHDQLLPHQLVNHFEKNTAVTTKVGLCHNLKNLIWFENVDIDQFYPRCFDLAETGELDDFVQEFKVDAAESLLKRFVAEPAPQNKKLPPVHPSRILVALAVCQRRLMDLDELIDNPAMMTLVTQAEWEILVTTDKSQFDQALSKHAKFLTKLETRFGDQDLRGQVVKALAALKKKFPQSGLNGLRNMWMMKPAGLSRGRGIAVFNQLGDIMQAIRNKEHQWVIQKYIENPLIVHHRKFDIRQWVLVTDWNPLTIWFYNECYVRFSAKKYDPNNLGNKYIHLCNNSINKHSKGSNYDHDDQIGEGLMWDNEEFQTWLEEHFGFDIWAEQLQPQLKDIVIHSLKSVQDMVENRKNSFEMFGYDFMVDEDGNPWLIEINSSPAMDYSSSVTERMVKEGLHDIIKVVVDYHFASHKRRAHVDTGSFELIHRAKRQVDRPSNCFGLNLCVEGKRMKY